MARELEEDEFLSSADFMEEITKKLGRMTTGRKVLSAYAAT